MSETVIFSVVCIALMAFGVTVTVMSLVSECRATKRHKEWMEEMRRKGFMR